MKEQGTIVIETIDGRAFVGTSLRDCVQKIRASAWACTEPSLKGYMDGVAKRAFDWTKSGKVRTNTIENFVRDMEAVGLYRVIKIS
jgi:hypothetical protein